VGSELGYLEGWDVIRIQEEMGLAWCQATVVQSGGPERVTEEPSPSFVPRPVGFTARLASPEVDPMVWEGDDA